MPIYSVHAIGTDTVRLHCVSDVAMSREWSGFWITDHTGDPTLHSARHQRRPQTRSNQQTSAARGTRRNR